MGTVEAIENSIQEKEGRVVLKKLSIALSVIITALGISSAVIGSLSIARYHAYLESIEVKYTNTAYLFVGVSLAVVVTGIVGIIGSVQLNQRIIYAFGTLLVIFFLLQGIVGGVFLVYNKTVEKSVSNSLDEGIAKYASSKSENKFIDWMQSKGCQSKLENFLGFTFTIISSLGIVTATMEGIALVVTFLLHNALQNGEYEEIVDL